jgi:hypothetical protein
MEWTVIPTAAVVAVLVASPAVSKSENGATVFQVTLTGAAEVAAGDPDGTGRATIRINPRRGELCYQLRVSGIEPATAAHVHDAPPKVAGPVVAPLQAPTSGSSKGCVTISKTLAQEIISDPGEYYVNVHNDPYPGGALRGQLG